MSSSAEINRHYTFKYFGYLEDAGHASKSIKVQSLQKMYELAKSPTETVKIWCYFLYKVSQTGRGNIALKMPGTRSVTYPSSFQYKIPLLRWWLDFGRGTNCREMLCWQPAVR